MNFGQLIPAGFSTEDIIVISAAIAAAVSALAVWQALLVRDDLTPRLKALAERRAALKANMLANTPRARRKASETLMHSVVARLNLLRSREAERARMALARAGIRSHDAVVTYLFCKIVMPFVLGAAAIASMDWLQLITVEETYRLPAALGAVLLGFLAPGIYVKNAADKRRAAMQKGLPDALDLLVICAEAGLSLDAALTRVAREIGPSCPELADELGLASIELGFLPERREALENLNRRTEMSSIRGVVNTLLQTEKYGTPLAQSLRVLAAEFRNERLMKAEEKAARLPAILTVPMIIFILPPLFIVLLGPAILRTIDALRSL
ncbi:MAG TPA: type II secretion system F family protein [Alphaproteobacteria bacterium]|nr:type II secretion system F family protein [Alphaproteobacteria bacterium]